MSSHCKLNKINNEVRGCLLGAFLSEIAVAVYVYNNVNMLKTISNYILNSQKYLQISLLKLPM